MSPGLRIEKGSELYRIVDLRRVWILVDLYEKDIGRIRPGGTARVLLRQQQKVYQAKVSEVLPQFDAASRTLKLRLEADNPGYCLRPDMFVDVEFPVTFPSMLNIPAEAVLYSGLRKTVFVDRGNGLFEPREVETGRQFGGRVEIVKGLREGERIVSSGNFLIDSESRTDLARSQSKRIKTLLHDQSHCRFLRTAQVLGFCLDGGSLPGGLVVDAASGPRCHPRCRATPRSSSSRAGTAVLISSRTR